MARNRGIWRLFIAVLLSTPLVLVAPPAQANFGSEGDCDNGSGIFPASCVSLGNNYAHSVRFISINQFTGIGIATGWALDTQYNPTDLTAYRDDSDTLADVNMYDDDYGNNGVAGWVVCNNNNTGELGSDPYRSCRGQSMSFNVWAANQNSAYFQQGNLRRLACHELGHTVGLRHWNHTGSASCMLTQPLDSTIEGLSSTDRGHIDAYYS